MSELPRIEVPVKFNNAVVGSVAVYADGSMVMKIDPIPASGIGAEIFDLLHTKHIGHCSFAFELGDERLWRRG